MGERVGARRRAWSEKIFHKGTWCGGVRRLYFYDKQIFERAVGKRFWRSFLGRVFGVVWEWRSGVCGGEENDESHFLVWSVGVVDWERNQCGDCMRQIWFGTEARKRWSWRRGGGVGSWKFFSSRNF